MNGRRSLSRRRRQRGSALFELPLLVGLIMIPFGLLVISVPTWVERQTAARDAAGEVGRAIVVGGSPQAALASIERGYELPPGALQVSYGSSFEGGDSVVVEVTVAMPAVELPIFGSFGHLTWTAEHTERFPDYGAEQ